MTEAPVPLDVTLRSESKTIWITGLSGAGKTTLAYEITRRLRASGTAVVMLDGDQLRELFGTTEPNAINYGREGRLALAMKYARLCRILADQQLMIVISTISLFQEVHEWNRIHIPGYFEVYLRVPMDELRRRDPKDIYRRFDSGEVRHVAGLDLPVDEPVNPDVLIEYDPGRPVEVVAAEVLGELSRRRGTRRPGGV